MTRKFAPANRPARYPLGKDGRQVTQIELYDCLTNRLCDLSDIAAVVEPIIVAAQIEPTELWDVITNV